MKNPRVARRYAQALMSVAEEQDSVEEVAADLAMMERTLAASRELRLLLVSPVVFEAKKAAVMKALFGGKTSVVVSTFVDLLIDKHRESILREVIEQFLGLRDELRGIMTVDVTTVTPMERKQEESLAQELGKRTGKTIKFRVKEDPLIKGGLVVKIGDTVLDASVRRQLERLRERFVGTARTSTL